jgi:hypothetical protein|tara:strand:- start:116 stop:379 length:264 start_codon:yes stop_codon:yes gene_type:complete
MASDFMGSRTGFEEEERFIRLCEIIEDAIRETGAAEDRFSDFEIMQAMDFVGFDLFRDNWEEFKKMETARDLSTLNFKKERAKKHIN